MPGRKKYNSYRSMVHTQQKNVYQLSVLAALKALEGGSYRWSPDETDRISQQC